jgi:hypothetical protein
LAFGLDNIHGDFALRDVVIFRNPRIESKQNIKSGLLGLVKESPVLGSFPPDSGDMGALMPNKVADELNRKVFVE